MTISLSSLRKSLIIATSDVADSFTNETYFAGCFRQITDDFRLIRTGGTLCLAHRDSATGVGYYKAVHRVPMIGMDATPAQNTEFSFKTAEAFEECIHLTLQEQERAVAIEDAIRGANYDTAEPIQYQY